ncbi:hypothetical protein ACWGH7_27165 [Streptomyces cyaneofuscatus]
MNESNPQVILYSRPDYTGDSYILPADGDTYTLAATGLDKISSIKIPGEGEHGFGRVVELYHELPENHASEDNGKQLFAEDTPDTGEWASAGWVRAEARSEVRWAGAQKAGMNVEEDAARSLGERTGRFGR